MNVYSGWRRKRHSLVQSLFSLPSQKQNRGKKEKKRKQEKERERERKPPLL